MSAPKGGCGKTTVARLLAEYLQDEGRLSVCLDADPLNDSLSNVKALNPVRLPVLKGRDLDVHAIDEAVGAIVDAEHDALIDSGAASFVPLNDYLVVNDMLEYFSMRGKMTKFHTVVNGGPQRLDTLRGFDALLHAFPGARFVVWVNAFFGNAELEALPIYRDNKDRIDGVIHLRALDKTYLQPNFVQMLESHMTFGQALVADSGFNTMERHRLARIKDELWEQLRGVV